MKKLTLLIFTIIISTSTALAQDRNFDGAAFGDNWFIQGQIGGSYTLSENYKDASLSDVFSPHIVLSAGKHFSHNLSTRIQLEGWESKNYFEINNAKGTYKVNYLQTSVDGLLNLSNLFASYNSERKFNILGIAGIGYAQGFKNKDRNIGASSNIVPRLGLQGDLKLNDDLSLNLEVIGNMYPDSFNGRKEGSKYEGALNFLVGITYQLTK